MAGQASRRAAFAATNGLASTCEGLNASSSRHERSIRSILKYPGFRFAPPWAEASYAFGVFRSASQKNLTVIYRFFTLNTCSLGRRVTFSQIYKICEKVRLDALVVI